MSLKVMRLTEEQQAELQDMQAEIMQMFVADPDKPGVILAQVIPPMGVIRVRVIGPDIVAKLARILPVEWANEGWGEPIVLDGFLEGVTERNES